MTKNKQILASRVPELSFIDREYKFHISVDMVTLGRKKREPGVLTGDYLKIGEEILPLKMRDLNSIETDYEEGKVHFMSVNFSNRKYSYELFLGSDYCLQVSAKRQTKSVYYLYFAVVNLAKRKNLAQEAI